MLARDDRRARAWRLVLGSIVLTGGIVAGSLGAAVSSPAPSRAASGVPLVAGYGITMPGLPADLSGLESLDASVGAAPSTVMWYEQWSSAPNFPASGASAVLATGAIPEISWEPWNPADGIDQPAYSLAAIASGVYDSYIRTWASEIKQWGSPLELRFAAEMNGNWYPWDEGVNGNTPGSFVAAWRHVHDIFTAMGADNVSWIWSPNVVYDGSTSLAELFPGDSYVNAVALDGYNWGSVEPDSTWQSFSQVFSESLTQLAALSDLPIYLGEVGCTEDGGDKASWIRAMFAQLADWRQVRGFTWFDYDKETDWRIDSSPASLAAFATGIASFDGESLVLAPPLASGASPSTTSPPSATGATSGTSSTTMSTVSASSTSSSPARHAPGAPSGATGAQPTTTSRPAPASGTGASPGTPAQGGAPPSSAAAPSTDAPTVAPATSMTAAQETRVTAAQATSMTAPPATSAAHPPPPAALSPVAIASHQLALGATSRSAAIELSCGGAACAGQAELLATSGRQRVVAAAGRFHLKNHAARSPATVALTVTRAGRRALRALHGSAASWLLAVHIDGDKTLIARIEVRSLT